MKRKFLQKAAKKLAENVSIVYFAMKHPKTPWYAKVLGALVLLYALSPIDLIPDFIPVIGLLDDFIIVPLGLFLVLKMIPKDVVKEIEHKVKRKTIKSSILGAVLVFTIWLFVLVIALSYFVFK